jgi:hypothetical protein
MNNNETSNGLMTRSEREDLLRIARKREKVAKTDASHRAAQLKANFEQQLDTRYTPEQDPVWEELYKNAERVVAEAQKKLARDCTAKGIPEQCAPQINLIWFERGRNTFRNERAEMRRVAYARIDELEKAAKVEIERVSLSIQTDLIRDSLQSSQAKAFLDRMPSADALMPALALTDVEASLTRSKI